MISFLGTTVGHIQSVVLSLTVPCFLQVHAGILEWETGLKVTRNFTVNFGADIYWSHMDTLDDFAEKNAVKYHKTMSTMYNDAV